MVSAVSHRNIRSWEPFSAPPGRPPTADRKCFIQQPAFLGRENVEPSQPPVGRPPPPTLRLTRELVNREGAVFVKRFCFLSGSWMAAGWGSQGCQSSELDLGQCSWS